MNIIIELTTGQGLCVGTGWTVQGVRECLRDRGPHSGLVGPWQDEEGHIGFPKAKIRLERAGGGGAGSTSPWMGLGCGPGSLALTLCCQRRCHPGAVPSESSPVLAVGAGWGAHQLEAGRSRCV